MIRFLEYRVADQRILRLVRKWLKAGVIEDGEWKANEEGADDFVVGSNTRTMQSDSRGN
jgi:hypothetical protein